MSEFTNWLQGNWYEAGSLLVQFAILGAIVWFARKAVNAIWAIWILQAQGTGNARTGMDDVSVARAGRAAYAAPRKRVSVFAAVGAALRGAQRWLKEPVRSGRQRTVLQA
ncbi:MAG: hypothetical protein LAN71_11225 [Acidobacteriia bacterium]|nr:hypothetical protein [Terriglobia bacterium]